MIYCKVSQGDNGDDNVDPVGASTARRLGSLSYSDDENDDNDDDYHHHDDDSNELLSSTSCPLTNTGNGNRNSTTAVNTMMRRTRSERISDKLHALAWVIVATITAHFTNLFPILYSDTTRILRPMLHFSLFLFGINILLTIYLTIYLPYKYPTSKLHKVNASTPAFWEVYCPNVIPTMTACGVLGILVLVRAVYPVYGMASPLVLGVVGLGMFFSLHFVPVFG